MLKVSNKGVIRRLSLRSLRASRTRNIIAVLAVALTTVLFTALFTIAMSINEGFQQSNFRQCGGWSHGTFKYLTEEQFEQLKDEPMISEWGLRRFVGMPTGEAFSKSHVELGYSDANQAHWMFCDPVEGRLPLEGSDEAATDLHVLELLGIEPRLGARFTLTFDVDGRETTQSFSLCGWWEYDEAVVANHVLIPLSRAEAIYDQVGLVPGQAADGMTGTWNLDVMFKNALHIERDVRQVLANHGYQDENPAESNYIATGVNWGYTGAQLADSLDPGTALAVAAVLLLIIFTGYLIIYNVFQISVTNDIRFYGMLKTIGTTPAQLRRIISLQALLLSIIGIPLGMAAGWFIGAALSPVVIGQLNSVVSTVSASPLIFLASALFALLTVLLSCLRPGRMAAKVSPVEALRYTEGGGVKRTVKKSGGAASLFSMARANLGRSKTKTAVTVLSMALAVVLLNLTVTFTKGFDMDKYLRDMPSDFVLADASYFGKSLHERFSRDGTLPQEIIEQVQAQGGITGGGRIYGKTSAVQEFVTEDYYRQAYSRWKTAEELDNDIRLAQKNEAGLIADTAQLYGMEAFALDKLTVLEGDLSRLYEPGGNYIAAVYGDDDYGAPEMDSHWARLGDTVTLRYVEEFEYYNPITGELYGAWENVPENTPYWSRAVSYRDVDYTVAALVMVPNSLNYRYYGNDEFVLNDQTFIRDSQTDSVMLYTFDTADELSADMEAFLADYTTNINPRYDYESKLTYAAEFEGFRSMFLLLGGVLSFIVALVGVLNFFNAILTGIITRRREFAMLQSVGMSGRQLKAMLVYEGLLYALGSGLLALGLAVVLGPLAGNALEGLFWFFSYSFTAAPALLLLPVFTLLGILVPLAVYRHSSRATLVERLREAEN